MSWFASSVVLLLLLPELIVLPRPFLLLSLVLTHLLPLIPLPPLLALLLLLLAYPSLSLLVHATYFH